MEPLTERAGTLDLTTAGAGATKPTVVGVLRVFLARVLRDPVRHGRLRNVAGQWPAGLGAIVALSYAVYATGVVIVIFSSAIRANAELSVSSASSASMPRSLVWLLLFFVLFALALFQTSAMHASWWLRAIGLIASALVMGTWSLRYSSTTGGLVETVLGAVLIVALVVFSLVRGGRPFVWWEFPAVLALLSAPVVLGVNLLHQTSGPLGFDLVPGYLGSMMTTLALAALPAVVAAGLSVAEITVSATLWATRLTAGLVAGRLAYLILALLLVLRLAQAGAELATWDFVKQGVNVFLTWILAAAVLAGLSALMLRLSGVGEHLAVSHLPERMAGMALALGLGLVGLSFFAVVVLGVFSILAALMTEQMAAQSGDWMTSLTSVTGPNLFRILFAGALIGLAVRFARRAQPGTALLLSAVAVMVLTRVVRWATGGVLDAGTGFTALNLVATAILLVALAVTAFRQRLTPMRAVGFSGALVLSALLGYHDFVSDPVGAVLGFSGAGLVLFGLTWGLFTDNAYANSGSRRYSVPTRALFVLANVIVAISILAYSSLVRDPTATVNLNDFAVLGDEVLGTALLAAAFISVLTAVRSSRPID